VVAFGQDGVFAGLTAKEGLRKSKVLRKINEPNWHGLEVKGGEL
jgi:hypothetical protein